MKSETEWDRLRWKSRRGMKELDLMLEPYVAERLPLAGDREFEEYDAFLDCSDLELFRVLLRRQAPARPSDARAAAAVIAYREEKLKGTSG